MNTTEVFLLAVQIRGDIVAHEGEEGGDTERFVAVAHDLKVDGVLVKEYAKECDKGINRDHE